MPRDAAAEMHRDKPQNGFSFPTAIRRAAGEAGIDLVDSQIRELQIHYRMLEDWNARMNLTAIREPEQIIKRHFLEGLHAGEALRRNSASGTLVDLGSGNGFPSVPIHVACPEARPVILVESSKKRSAFLRALLRELEWRDSRVETRRVERGSDLEDLPCDIFTTRGVTPFALLREGLPFLKTGGIALLFMSRTAFEKGAAGLPSSFRLETEFPLPGRDSGLILLRKT